MYTPTEKWLTDNGFTKLSQGFAKSLNYFSCITYNKNGWFCNGQIYPQTKSDIEILIRLFSKP